MERRSRLNCVAFFIEGNAAGSTEELPLALAKAQTAHEFQPLPAITPTVGRFDPPLDGMERRRTRNAILAVSV
ncbi:hypothetical protein ACFOYU_26120 [Microvirga sp. GCM10011540]|uniref:hypothetical protein n=1 Tax=Microvirga sp. GCM10011540 TaxID=3317338 RepID=UPI0036149FF3